MLHDLEASMTGVTNDTFSCEQVRHKLERTSTLYVSRSRNTIEVAATHLTNNSFDS